MDNNKESKMSNVVELRPNKHQEDAWKVIEEINILQHQQDHVWESWANIESEIYEKTKQFDELFKKIVAKNGYSNIPAIFCEYTSLVTPQPSEDGKSITYYYADNPEEE